MPPGTPGPRKRVAPRGLASDRFAAWVRDARGRRDFRPIPARFSVQDFPIHARHGDGGMDERGTQAQQNGSALIQASGKLGVTPENEKSVPGRPMRYSISKAWIELLLSASLLAPFFPMSGAFKRQQGEAGQPVFAHVVARQMRQGGREVGIGRGLHRWVAGV